MMHTKGIGNVNGTHMSGKRSFRLEREMLGSARAWLESRGLIVRTEFAFPWGICDLVGVSFISSRVKQRLRLGQRNPIGSPRRIDILNRIPDISTGRSMTITGLIRQVGEFMKPEQVESDIAALIASRFVVRRTSNTLQKLNGWMPLSKRIVTVELKLNRVSEVLSQAKAHRQIADEVYIGLPAPLAERVALSNRREPFRENGIGILGISGSDCRVMLPASKTPVDPYSVLKTHCVERVWRTSLRDRSA